MRKLLNITPSDSNYSADTDDEDGIGSDSETEGDFHHFPSNSISQVLDFPQFF